MELEEVMPPEMFASKLSRLAGIVWILPSCMAFGWVVGYFVVDRYFESFPWGTILFILVGAGVGFYDIIRLLFRKAPDA